MFLHKENLFYFIHKIPRDHSSLIIYLCRLKWRDIRFQSKLTIILTPLTPSTPALVWIVARLLPYSISNIYDSKFENLKLLHSPTLPPVKGYKREEKMCNSAGLKTFSHIPSPDTRHRWQLYIVIHNTIIPSSIFLSLIFDYHISGDYSTWQDNNGGKQADLPLHRKL